MNLNELVTYIEELTFRTTMFGYDRDEVDVQLDKINDEIMDLVKAKDAEIAALKSGEVVVESPDSAAAGAAPGPEKKESGLFDLYVDGEEPEAAEDGDSEVNLESAAAEYVKEIAELKDQIAALEEKLHEATERAEYAEAQLSDANERADHLENRVLELEEQIAEQEKAAEEALTPDISEQAPEEEEVPSEEEFGKEPEEEPAEASDEESGEDDEEDDEPAVLLVDEDTEEVEEPEKSIPVSTDEAYNQYLRNADLLCRQLSLIDDQKASILGEAKAEADSIVTQARTEADSILEEANAQAETIVGDANAQAEELRADLEEQKKTILEEIYAEKDERLRNLEEDRVRYEELARKKAEVLSSLRELSEEVQAIADDFDDELESDEEA